MHVLPRHGATHLLLKIGPLTVLLGFFCDASVDSQNPTITNQIGIGICILTQPARSTSHVSFFAGSDSIGIGTIGG